MTPYWHFWNSSSGLPGALIMTTVLFSSYFLVKWLLERER